MCQRKHLLGSWFVLAIVGLSSCSKPADVSIRDPTTASTSAPKPPQWVENVPAVPVWWSDVSVIYSEESPVQNRITQLREMEIHITEAVRKGLPAVKERRQLIKYLSFWSESPSCRGNDRRVLAGEIADTYAKLGDYRMAAKGYAKIVNDYPRDVFLYALAVQYERVGDKKSAIQIYDYMARAFESNSIYVQIAVTGVNCLSGRITSNSILRKPDWWSQYQTSPNWGTNLTLILPKFSCFEDGCNFVVHTEWKRDDVEEPVKAWMSLSEFTPLTFKEEITALLAISHAYSELGDHHRAIEVAWKIPERFSCDVENSNIALKFIASEFEKLGELDHAQEVKKGASP